MYSIKHAYRRRPQRVATSVPVRPEIVRGGRDTTSDSVRRMEMQCMFHTINSPKLSFEHKLPGKIFPGTIVAVMGTINPTANQFGVNLRCKGKIPEIEPDIFLHIGCSMYKESIVRNTYTNGRWQIEEDEIPCFPLRRAETFEIMILAQHDCFKIAINDKHFALFKYRLPLSLIDSISVVGDVQLRKIHFSKQYPSDDCVPRTEVLPQLGDKTTPPVMMTPQASAPSPLSTVRRSNPVSQLLNPPVPFCCKIPGQGLRPGLHVVITGKPHASADRFAIDFQKGSSAHPTEIALHFNPRFGNEYRLIVRNTLLNDKWGPEETQNGLPLQRGNDFQIRVIVYENIYDIRINDRFFAEYHHRFTYLPKIDHLRVSGDLELKSIAFIDTAY